MPNSTVVPPEYNGTGQVYLVDTVGTRLISVGTIDYDTGKLTLNAINVVSLYGTDFQLKLRTRPHDDSKDILTSILTRTSDVSTSSVIAKPAQNTVLSLDNTVASAITGSRKGLDISVTTENKGY